MMDGKTYLLLRNGNIVHFWLFAHQNFLYMPSVMGKPFIAHSSMYHMILMLKCYHIILMLKLYVILLAEVINFSHLKSLVDMCIPLALASTGMHNYCMLLQNSCRVSAFKWSKPQAIMRCLWSKDTVLLWSHENFTNKCVLYDKVPPRQRQRIQMTKLTSLEVSSLISKETGVTTAL